LRRTLELKKGSGDNDPITESGHYPQATDRLGGDGGVDREGDEGAAALGVAGDLHAGDVDAGADHAGTVLVDEEREVVGGLEVDVEAVDLDQPLLLVDPERRRGGHQHGHTDAPV
jgi:hypothetical protein